MTYRVFLPLVALLVCLMAPAALADIAPSPVRPPPADAVEVLPAPAAPVLADIPPPEDPEPTGAKKDLVWPIVGGSAAVLLGVGLSVGLRRRKNGND